MLNEKGYEREKIALACSGPPLSSNVLNAWIGRVAYVSTLRACNSMGRPAHINLVYNTTVLQV